MRNTSVLNRVLMVLVLIAVTLPVVGAAESPDNRITIVYNNIAGDTNPNLEAAGGFGAWIEFDDKVILFDTGGETSVLIDNLKALKLDIGELDAVFVSHNHWDHVYGLPRLLGEAGFKPTVYVPGPGGDSIHQQNPRATIVRIDEPTQIHPNIWSTGVMTVERMNTSISEQALVMEDEDGIYVITGCAHPGIVEIVERSKAVCPDKPVMLVAGGYHLRNHSEKDVEEISSTFKKLGVVKIGPSHCTGQNAIEFFEEEWRSDFVQLNLGDQYDI